MKQIVAPSLGRANAKLPVSSLPFSAMPHQSKLFLEYLRDPRSLSKYYPNAPAAVPDLIAYIPKVLAGYKCDRLRLCEALTEINSSIGSGDRTFGNIKLLSESDTVAVVTGQQAGLFTGPVYTIYKALTAIKLAEQLNSLGTRAVPVFWAATEDHDFDEVSRAFFIGSEVGLKTIQYLENAVKNSPVGNVRLDRSVTTVIDQLFNSISDTEFSYSLRRSIENAWHEGALFGKAFQTELAELLSKYGLVFVDPLAGPIKKLAAPIYAEAISRGDAIVTAIRERDGQLVVDGFHSQVLVEEDYFPFFWHTDDGQRVALRQVRDGVYKSKDDTREFTLLELSDIAANEPQRFSPGVMLRPVVQDYLLPSACYIGGAAEIAYFAQNSVAYQVLGRPVTPIVNRQSVTVIESKHKRTLEKFGLEFKDLFLGVDALLERIGRDQLSSQTQKLFDEAETAITDQLVRLERELARVDPTLLPDLVKRRQKMMHHVSALRKKANLAMVRKDKTAERQIREAFTALLPNGQLQERVINVNSFLNKYGLYFLDLIYDAIDPKNREHLIVSI